MLSMTDIKNQRGHGSVLEKVYRQVSYVPVKEESGR